MKILLFSDSESIFNLTSEAIGNEHELVWCTYNFRNDNCYPKTDMVILHFNQNMVQSRNSEMMINIKGCMGVKIPILTVIEGGTPQEIYSMIKLGAFDYIDLKENMQYYKTKIKEIILWCWYLKNMALSRDTKGNITLVVGIMTQRGK